MVLTVEISLVDGMHIYGRQLPDGYIPVELTLEDANLELVGVDYPQSESVTFKALGETLSAYSKRLTIKAHCRAINKDQDRSLNVIAKLKYQACDERQCYPPQTVVYSLPLQFLPHDWERIK